MSRRLLPLVLLAAALVACGSSDRLIGPSNQLQVTNAPDDFQFQVTALDRIQQTVRYTWTNTGDSASVNQASAITGGSATLTIKDAIGTVVYQAALDVNGTVHTAKGTAGAWRIEVRLQKVSGALNFRVQKAP